MKGPSCSHFPENLFTVTIIYFSIPIRRIGGKKEEEAVNKLFVGCPNPSSFFVLLIKSKRESSEISKSQVHSNSSSLFIRKNIPLQLLLLIFPPYFSNLLLIFDVTHDRHRPL
jgi:hypothetical protein